MSGWTSKKLWKSQVGGMCSSYINENNAPDLTSGQERLGVLTSDLLTDTSRVLVTQGQGIGMWSVTGYDIVLSSGTDGGANLSLSLV